MTLPQKAQLTQLVLNCLLVLWGGANDASAHVTLPAVFNDGMILQRDRPISIWGWADPGEPVAVTLDQASAAAVADEAGKWRVELPARTASTEPLELRVFGDNDFTIGDILIGDVWLCGGQSNMEWSLGACKAQQDIETADFPHIRLFDVELNFANSPQSDVKGRWQTCSPQTAAGFTAVGFYFARRVHEETDVPIGLLQSCVGGTNIELWIAEETLLNDPALSKYADVMRKSLDQWRDELGVQLPALDEWSKAVKLALQEKKPIPAPPKFPEYPFGERGFRPRCVTLHNGMIAPLAPLAMRGFLWYQGENNAFSPADVAQYVPMMQALVKDWRRYFGHGELLPFYFVQLAPFQKPGEDPAGGEPWALMRDAQRQALEQIENSGMAVTVDIGDADDIHPANKFDVGERLARWALAKDYGRAIEPSGPLFRELKIDDDSARVLFDHVGKGLMIGAKTGREPVSEDPSAKLARFAIAGADRTWRWADARIEGDAVICTHPEVPSPVAVRYAHSMNPAGANLYNRDGLPASPFRSDDW